MSRRRKQSPRLVLGFYSSDARHLARVLLDARTGEFRRAILYGPDGEAEPRGAQIPYADLRLPGESLLGVRVPADRAYQVVERMRGAGSPAVFVVREDIAPPPELCLPAEPLAGHRLREFMREVVSQHGKPCRVSAPQSLLAQLEHAQTTIDIARGDLVEAARLDHALTAAAEWLLDNAYLVRSNVGEIRRHLPRGYQRILPSLKSRDGRLRVQELANELVTHTDFALTEGSIVSCLREYQSVEPLTIAELWTFPLSLRLGLIEGLAAVAARVSYGQQLREAAYLWANRLVTAARRDEAAFHQRLERMEAEPSALQPYFVTCLAEQLHDEERTLAPVQQWLEARLQMPVSELVRVGHNQEAAERISIANAFGSLRTLAQIEFAQVFEAVSLVEKELRRDPAGIYPRSDFLTRDRARRAVEATARAASQDELEVARRTVALASGASAEDDHRATHVGYYLLAEGITQLESAVGAKPPGRTRMLRFVRRHATGVYLGGIFGLTGSLLAVALASASDMGAQHAAILTLLSLLAIFPLSELAVQIVNALVIMLLPPEPLPKMDFRNGIPPECATLVAIPMMLSSAAEARREAEKLEIRFLGNRDASLHYSLLSDFLDADSAETADDEAVLAAAREAIDDLNRRYGGPRFSLFHRPRTWSETEQRWIGRERKRGKVEDLNAYLNGIESELQVVAGELPAGIRYVITLDADTQLPAGAASRMVAAIAHPLNEADIDPATNLRRRGYTIIQPRVSIALPGATATHFTRIFADAMGTDPYCQAVSDAYQDLFGEGIFLGKAIYDVRAFHRILGHRFPSERLLSHDLIEGAHAGVALASDIELFENFPVDYSSYSKRQHRWIRGDWQIAPWIFGRVPQANGQSGPNPLSAINRWRILDNLRRSLVPIASMLLLMFGWFLSASPVVWTVVVAVAVCIPAAAPLLDRAARRLHGSAHGWHGAADELVRSVTLLALLPHQAWLSTNAIGRALYRMRVSRRDLLEWETAAMADAATHHVGAVMRQLLLIASGSTVLMIVLIARGEFAPTSALVVLWMGSPLLARWMSLHPRDERKRSLNDDDIVFLRQTARRTWRYFDDLVGPSTEWLPPDNFQTSLRIEVAQRTSPTNIGLWLASALAARDLGYVTPEAFERRCSETLATMEKLEKYEGHLLNWYDTRTREPLLPRYVSTVDSGNLLASLWVLEQGCQDILNAPVIGPACLRGMGDTLREARALAENDPSAAGPIKVLSRQLRTPVGGRELIDHLRIARLPMDQLTDSLRWQLATDNEERSYWIGRLGVELNAWLEMVDRYLAWMEMLAKPPDEFLKLLGEDAVEARRRALRTIPPLAALARGAIPAVETLIGRRGQPDLSAKVRGWLEQFEAVFAQAQANAMAAVERLEALSAAAGRIAEAMNMRFLYDERRRLFAIGYLLGGPREFTSHYDLLASECRLASLVAIAKGDVPIEHWLALGRPRAAIDGSQALLSWSGTMFEYLTPLLFMRVYPNSLLEQACRVAVERQIEYCAAKQIPWGISESAYSALDANQIYQYRAFGVPGLGMKPGLEDDLVVAPYATAMALMVRPNAAVANLRRLADLGLWDAMGFDEAIDFTRERTREGERGVIIHAYMAHHQGMTLLALTNVLQSGVMQRRFHRDLRVRAVESLLYERLPVTKPALIEEGAPARTPVRVAAGAPSYTPTWNQDSRIPRIYLCGNGRYTLMLTNSGAGYSRWNEFDITRWRSDPALDSWGSYLYVRDLRGQQVWSNTYQPVGGANGAFTVHFAADRVEFRRRAFGIEMITEVTVAPEDAVELRRVTVVNQSARRRTLEFTSFQELALAPHAADRAHPAFAKMFVETEWLREGALAAHRRLRSPEDPPVWVAHFIAGPRGVRQYESDRRTFIGRGSSAAEPEGLTRDLNGSTGTVIDPAFALRCRVELEPYGREELTLVTVAAETREALIALVDRYRRREAVTRAFELAWTRVQLEFRYLGIGEATADTFQTLASHLVYPNSRLRPPAERLTRNRLGQSRLWAHGISGDAPIVAITISDPRGLSFVRDLLLAHTYWRLRGFRADLVILNQEEPGYDRPLHEQLLRLIQAHSVHTGVDKPGGAFLREWHNIADVERNLILAASSVVLSASRGPLPQQLAVAGDGPGPPRFIAAGSAAEEPSRPLPFLELPYFNGLGGFTADGREYAIYLKPGSRTPAPWANVMANPLFGTLVTESGLGFTWFGNSQANRLTPWHNDPVTDEQSEIVYLRDEESGAVWTPTALPIREQDAHRARHGQGYTVYEHNSHAIGQDVTVFVPLNESGGDPVKVCRLRLRNDSTRQRRLSATYFVEWVLGTHREEQQLHVQTAWDAEAGAVIARNAWNTAYGGYVAFAAASPRAASYSGDRTQFLGRNGDRARPEAMRRSRLDNRVGPGLDPGGALQVHITIDPGAEAEVTFLLGETPCVAEMRALASRYSSAAQVEAALTETRRWWDKRLGAIEVLTPVLAVNFLLNRWLLYQDLSCRYWGRSAFYQSGGAFGFRDQLQDVLAFLYAAPEFARAHILTAASRQFPEGDVQHWWHPEEGMGVRTRCSDDLVWLPFAVARYVDVTGDAAILDEPVTFIEGPLLGDSEHEKLFTPSVPAYAAPVWEHCRLALEHAWRLGPHDLPLIGNGDWNDGLNRVGVEGRGESVWLAWFLCATLEAFAGISDERDKEVAALCRQRAGRLAAAVEKSCWDGAWYLRGFFDNGAPLGSSRNSEACIDSIAQSWAALSGAGDPVRTRRAMESAEKHLVRERDRLILLFHPPFDRSEPHPGYIMGYPPGLRENGGQYTHGALWLVQAWARLGEGGRAVRLMELLNPVERNREAHQMERYQGEPYVIPADVYNAPGKVGRCGWTWYTGSAGWAYRVWLEDILGFHRHGNTLRIEPVIPDDWPGFQIHYRYGATEYEITIQRDSDGEGEGVEIQLDGSGGVRRVEVHLPRVEKAGEPELEYEPSTSA